ncbi:hypothetical protein K8S17_07175 [bacterium]|nr:hypothetical protein [bacterium]
MRVKSGDIGRSMLFVVGLALLLGVTFMAADTASARAEGLVLSTEEAASHVGEEATVCGVVASAAYLGRSNGTPTFLNLDKPYPDQPFSIVIWGSTRGLFEDAPEALFDGRRVCVTGTIETYKGKPQIIVDDPAQIEIADAPALPLDLDYEERVFLKLVMASLELGVNYGMGEWDAEAVLALVSFQEAKALVPTGLPDAATLRDLADAVIDIPAEEQTRIIRSMLMRLAQRGD